MKRIALVLVLFIVVLVGGYLAKRDSLQKFDGSFYKTAFNIQQPGIISSDVFFFTGSSFAKFSPKDGKTTKLSSYLATSGSVNISGWTDHSVIFSVLGANDADLFGSTAGESANYIRGGVSWWRYDIVNKKLQFIDFKGVGACSYIVEANGHLYCWMSENASKYSYVLKSYDIKKGVLQSILRVSGSVTSVKVAGNNIYYIVAQTDGARSLNYVSSASNRASKVFTTANNIIYSATGTSAYVAEQLSSQNKISNPNSQVDGAKTAKSKYDLFAFGLDGQIYSKKRVDLMLNSIVASQSSIIASTSDGVFYEYTDDSWHGFKTESSNSSAMWRVNNDLLVLDNNSVLSSSEKQSVLKSGEKFHEDQNSLSNSFYISSYRSGANNIYFNGKGKNFKTGSESVDVFLEQRGYDPNQFNFSWHITNVTGLTKESAGVEVLK